MGFEVLLSILAAGLASTCAAFFKKPSPPKTEDSAQTPHKQLAFSLLAVSLEDKKAALYNSTLFFGMLVGIAANYFWTAGIVAPVDWNQFIRPILISPIIFMPVYVMATKQPRGLIPLLIAFQNGFFWQTIFSKAGPLGS